ncbi:MAG: hypothetical protein ACU836_02885 [Gammaproteobacteria bacterium]
MWGVIAATAVAVWFYNTAPRSGRQPLSWAASGVVVYFLAALIWSVTVTPGIKDSAIHNPNYLQIFIVRYAYIGFGLAAAAIVNFWLNKPVD